MTEENDVPQEINQTQTVEEQKTEQEAKKPEELKEQPKQNEEAPEQVDEKEKERLKKQEEYRERKRKEKEEAEKRQNEYDKKVTEATQYAKPQQDQDEIEALKQFARQQKFERDLSQAEQELTALEKPFKEAFDDYDSVVEKALKFTEKAYVRKGMTELQAKEMLRREKILLADQAAALGRDPVEAVYNEAKTIVSVIDEMAAELGYIRGKPKTNLQAAKELAKPNALSGGTGTHAARKTFKEMDENDIEEISNITLGQLGLKK